jgi:hypothetical protein
MAVSIFFLIALLAAAIFSITTAAAYAQDSGMLKTTSKGTLDVRLEPMWSEGGQASFNVSFLNPGTGTLHEHQDYDFRILKDGQVVFSAARQTGQAVLHNVEGTLTVPYTFQENGDYTIQVYLAGTGISPIIPTDEEATFSITVTPEFPAGVMGAALAALMMITTTAILLSQRLKLI